MSLRCPGSSMKSHKLPKASVRARILVVIPPLDRPIACLSVPLLRPDRADGFWQWCRLSWCIHSRHLCSDVWKYFWKHLIAPTGGSGGKRCSSCRTPVADRATDCRCGLSTVRPQETGGCLWRFYPGRFVYPDKAVRWLPTGHRIGYIWSYLYDTVKNWMSTAPRAWRMRAMRRRSLSASWQVKWRIWLSYSLCCLNLSCRVMGCSFGRLVWTGVWRVLAFSGCVGCCLKRAACVAKRSCEAKWGRGFQAAW